MNHQCYIILGNFNKIFDDSLYFQMLLNDNIGISFWETNNVKYFNELLLKFIFC
jgi:hypothetical protein